MANDVATWFRENTGTEIKFEGSNGVTIEPKESGGARMLPGGLDAKRMLEETWPEHAIEYRERRGESEINIRRFGGA